MLHRMTPKVARLRNFSHLPKSVWSLGHCRLAFLTLSSSHFDPFVWSGRASQEVSSIWRLAVLHQCIRPLIGAYYARGHRDRALCSLRLR